MLKATFKVFDKDNDGFISLKELKEVFTSGDGGQQQAAGNEEDWLTMMKEVDTDNDGTISFQEFKGVMTKLAKAQVNS